MGRLRDFNTLGWTVFPPEPDVQAWVAQARDVAFEAVQDPAQAQQYACEGTWFVGLDALPNDAAGRIGKGPALTGSATDFIAAHCGGWPDLHRGQISGVFPGYPKPRAAETDAAFRYRLNRDAAHVDGVIGQGTPKRRYVREPHAFILGLPLTEADARAAPLVVWDGSHRLMQRAFAQRIGEPGGTPPENIDVTDVYVAARREAFATCTRRALAAPPGAAIVMHRMLLHGVAPFAKEAKADPAGRLIAYFRPPMPGGTAAWIAAP